MLVPNEHKELYYLLRKSTNRLASNIHHDKDNTYNKTRKLKNNKNIVLLSGKKGSSIVILVGPYSSMVEH